jgi:hypothetical protein
VACDATALRVIDQVDAEPLECLMAERVSRLVGQERRLTNSHLSDEKNASQAALSRAEAFAPIEIRMPACLQRCP